MTNLSSLIQELNKNLNEHSRANCFNAVELYWQDSKLQNFTRPQEFVEYISKKFVQISLNETIVNGDVSIVWSRSDFQLNLGQIELQDLASKREGYPYGLIIEHAFVHVDKDKVFHKPDPKPSSTYQLTLQTQAMNPYLTLKGFEMTRHRRLNYRTLF